MTSIILSNTISHNSGHLYLRFNLQTNFYNIIQQILYQYHNNFIESTTNIVDIFSIGIVLPYGVPRALFNLGHFLKLKISVRLKMTKIKSCLIIDRQRIQND